MNGASPLRFVTGRLQELAAALRGLGVRVGVGEVLAAHRALAAVDAGLARAGVLRAARDALLVARRPRAFALAFARRVRAPTAPPRRDPLAALGTIARAALPRVAVPGTRARRRSTLELEAGARRVERRGAAAREGLRRLHGRRARRRAAAARAPRGARADAPEPPHAPGAAARPTCPTCARPRARRCATAASCSSGAGARRRGARAGSCSCSTSRARWRRTRGMLLQYVQASVAARARVEAFAFGTQLTRLTLELAGRDPDRALARAAERVTDWSGGTRIGASLATLNREHGRRDRARRVRRPALGRLGPRRPGGARRRARPAAPDRAPARLAQPARGRSALRAAHARVCGPRCRTSTGCCRAIASRRWSSSRT